MRKPQDTFTVSANLAFRFYDEIEAGRKRTEYRDITPYWAHRLFKGENFEGAQASHIKFSRGYTKRCMTWTIRRIDIDTEAGVFAIRLGKRVA